MRAVTPLIVAVLALAGCRDTNPHPPYYRSCAEASAAGVTPLHAGDPGYSNRLDIDLDGIACE
jgi:hypothetical protein